jgi:predicted RNase H-like nuclease (RuvC/YqgF family)
MLAAPPSPTITVQEVQTQIDSFQTVLKDLQNSIADLHRAREQAEVFTPSQDQTDAIQSTVDRLESEIALTENKIAEIQKRIDDLRNNPKINQLAETQQKIDNLTGKIAELKQQTKGVAENAAELQAKIQELKIKNIDLEKQLAGMVALQLKVTVPKDSDKTSFILDYGQGTITVIPTDGLSKQTFFSRTQFSNWIASRDYKTEHFVVYVRPSRFGQHEEIIKDLQARGFDVGLQVIGEKTSLSLTD